MRCAQRYTPSRARRGSVLGLLAVSLVFIVGVMALVLDGGVLMAERQHGQSVADPAALAAANSLYNNYSVNNGLDLGGQANKAALSIAAGNGYANNGGPYADVGATSVVTVNIPPLTGPSSGTPGYAEVVVQYNQPRLLSAVWGAGTMSIGARAVARGIVKPYSGAGIILLDPSGQGALTLSGSASLKSNANVIVDSSNSKAVVGSSTANATAPEFDITGSYSLSGSSTLNGTARTGSSPTADPLAGLPQPDPTTLTTQSSSTVSVSGGTATLYPGVYNGGISISGGAAVTLQPGIYYMKGGGFKMSSSSSLLGTGVMIYNDPSSSGDVVSISGSGTLNLSPPTSGTYAGITLFQRRDATSAPSISGGSNASLSGTFYFASAAMTVSGSSGLANLGSQYISKDLTISGSGTVNLTWGSGHVARKRSLTLVE